MKETLEQINKLIENYIQVERLYDIACMRQFGEVEEELRLIKDSIRKAIVFATKSLMIIKGD